MNSNTLDYKQVVAVRRNTFSILFGCTLELDIVVPPKNFESAFSYNLNWPSVRTIYVPFSQVKRDYLDLKGKVEASDKDLKALERILKVE